MKPELTIRRSGEIYRFSLNRPDRGNALSAAVVEALHAGLDELERENARLLLLQGEGRNFCTGFDLDGIDTLTDAEILHRFVRIEQLLARLWSAPYATVAVGKGRVFGAGADLLTVCSHRLALPDASFSFPGAAFGLVLGTRRLAARVGAAVAEHLVSSGVVFDAGAARTFGLVTAVLEAAQLEAAIDNEVAVATRLDLVTQRAVRTAVGSEAGRLDSDLAMLVRSATRPGLGQRIAEYRARAAESRRAGAQDPKHYWISDGGKN